jgi:hypothetical protein
MRILKTALVVFLWLMTIVNPTRAGNPLIQEYELLNFLGQIWFVRSYDIKIQLTQDENQIEKISYFNLRGQDQNGNEFLFYNNQLYAITEGWNIGFVGDQRDPAMWRIPSEIEACCQQYFSSQKMYQILFARRSVNMNSIVYSEWDEGNIEYAQARGQYDFVNYLTNETTSHEFRLLVERNPASNGWKLTSYRGEHSFYDPADSYGLYLTLTK